jgi:predicted kinase
VATDLEDIIDIVRSTKATLFILCGLPYSGKTFVAKKILAGADCVYVSIDDLFHKAGYDWTTNKLPDKQGWDLLFKASYDATKDALKASKSVLYDSTNHTRQSRDALREVARSVDANSFVLFVDVPADLILTRWEANKLNPTRSVVAKELVLQTIDSFERPTEDEHLLTVSGLERG